MAIIQNPMETCATIQEAIAYLLTTEREDKDFYNTLYQLAEQWGQSVGCPPPQPDTGLGYLFDLNEWIGYTKALLEQRCPLPPLGEVGINLDRQFFNLMKLIESTSVRQIEEYMVDSFKKIDEINRREIQNYARRFPMWGDIDYRTGRGSMVIERANCLKEHREDFIWLYNRLCDHRSRYALVAILNYWMSYNFQFLGNCKEMLFPDYFDPDILPISKDEVIADVGAYIGDTAFQFAQLYEKCKKMYCYEIDPSNAEKARKNTQKFPFVEIRQKAVSDHNGTLCLNLNSSDSSASQVTEKGSVEVPAVTLDDDIKEPLTLIKMDIEGAEQSALRGCKRHIVQDKPKLAICTYHGNQDIWQIPRMIDAIRNDYKFYMRFNGGNLFPTEYVFFAI